MILMARIYQPGHLPVKKCHEQCPDMGTINISICHDDDFVVPEFA